MFWSQLGASQPFLRTICRCSRRRRAKPEWVSLPSGIPRKSKDGREVWLSDTAVIVQGSDSHPVMEGIMVDITERKALETQLQQSRKMEAVGRLAADRPRLQQSADDISGYTELALSRPQLSRRSTRRHRTD